MSHPTNPKAYGDTKDTPPEHPSAHTSQCPKRQLSHQQTKTAADEARTASHRHSLLDLIFMAGTQAFDRTQKNSNKDPHRSTNHDGTLIDIPNTSQWISH